VDNIAVALEHVDLLNGLDRLNVQLLESSLELLVVNTRVLWLGLLLSSWGTLSAVIKTSSVLNFVYIMRSCFEYRP
jgi:hypothetical protein